MKEEEQGWRDSLYRAYKSGQQSMRVAVYGCKHDAAMFEELLKEYCLFDTENMLGTAMIDTACLNTPKVTCHQHKPCHSLGIAGSQCMQLAQAKQWWTHLPYNLTRCFD